MSQPLLIIDVHYLCHRAYHTSKDLTWKGKATGAIFGFLKSITSLKDEFQTDQIAFCFEHPVSFRRKIEPTYKLKRATRERTPEEQKAYQDFVAQVRELRTELLPRIGFNNIFSYEGMESDDIMAALANATNWPDTAVMVTADQDMYQCLRPHVSMYSPQTQTMMTATKFKQKYGIQPGTWSLVKAIAGCHSDEVKGIPGVGEKTAIKAIRGLLSQDSKAWKAIQSKAGYARICHNRQLVELPFRGCPTPTIQPDCVTKKAWLEVCQSLGMHSIAGRPPVSTRTQARYI